MDSATRPHVVIIGTGFGGLACAKALAKSGAVRVTVIDRFNFHTFLPLLYQVATSGLNPGDVAYPARGVLRRLPGVDMIMGTVTGIDPTRRVAKIGDVEITFDHLVIAAGSRAAFFGVDGAEEHAFTLYSLNEAVGLRNHILGRFEAAMVSQDLVGDGALDVVVVGGGPTGVEMAGALAELNRHVLTDDFPQLPVERARVTLVEQADALLAPFSGRSRDHALEALTERGVDVRLSTAVDSVSANRVRLADGTELRAHTVVWAAGVQAAALASEAGCAQGRGGRIVVEPDLSVPGCDGMWAIGDAAQIPDVTGSQGAYLPQLAQVAIQSGNHVAAQIVHRIRGRETEPLTYRDKGIMATIGRRSAVAELPIGLKLRGVIAWIAWLALHLVTLLGMRNRALVLVSWSWNYLTWDRGARLIIDPSGPDRTE